MKTKSSSKIILCGFTINESGVKSDKMQFIQIENGKIVDINIEKPVVSEDVITIELSATQVISPSFLDLHTHIEYNMIPNWDYPEKAPWDNRHEWRNNSKYSNDISDVHKYLLNSWCSDYDKSTDDFRMLGEIQSIAGGTTVLQETEAYKGSASEPSKHILIRSTGSAEEIGIESDKLIFSVIDFYKPDYYNNHKPDGDSGQDTSSWIPIKQDKLDYFDEHTQDDFIKVTLVHLAEGRAGFLKDSYDAYSRKEFETFKTYIESKPVENIINHHISIIHGCGVDIDNSEHIDFLKKYGISILWAPISNTLLYSDTINAFKFLDKGVNVALGSDWSPSGGKHVWDEAKFAYSFCSMKYKDINKPDLAVKIYQMITTNAAKCLGNKSKFGKIAVDSPADFVVINLDGNKTPLETLFSSDDSCVYCVIVNGRVLYGEKHAFDNMKKGFTSALNVDYQSFPENEGKYAKNKFISVNRELNFDLKESTQKLEKMLWDNKYRKWERSKYLVADDIEYQGRINKLKNDLKV